MVRIWVSRGVVIGHFSYQFIFKLIPWFPLVHPYPSLFTLVTPFVMYGQFTGI